MPQVLLPSTLQPGNVLHAAGMLAGRWIFATGRTTMPVFDESAPRHALAKHKVEAQHVFQNFARLLDAAGSERKNVVRVDQYYTGARAVDPYHEVRREFFGGHIPPSTSNLHRRLLLAGQDLEVQMIAVVPSRDFTPVQHRPPNLPVHASSGYSPVLTCGDYVFVAGQTSEALNTGEGPLDPRARMPAGHLWKGTPIKLEAEFVIEHKLKPALATVGNTLAEVVKAQVYLRDLDDIPGFNEIWARHFGAAAPATSIITTATPGFICEPGRIEINTLSVRKGGATKKERIDAGVPMPYAGQAQAVRAGDLLFLGGLMAVDETGGLARAVRLDPGRPYFGSPCALQADYLLSQAERICAKAGTSLANVVRAQHFHTDLAGFDGAWQAWQKHLPGRHIPFSAVEVPALAVPGAVVMLDLWVHVP